MYFIKNILFFNYCVSLIFPELRSSTKVRKTHCLLFIEEALQCVFFPLIGCGFLFNMTLNFYDFGG